jgi:hypothetical protein
MENEKIKCNVATSVGVDYDSESQGHGGETFIQHGTSQQI